MLDCGRARSLSDIDRSTAANDGQVSTLFSAPKNPHRIPANTPPVFQGLRPRICLPLVSLVTNGNVGQAPARTLLSTLILLITLAGCASTQEAEDRQALTFLQVKAAPDSIQGQSTVFGGRVLTARRQKDGTRIEILQLPLDRSLRPVYDLTQSQGRFIAIYREFLDPATLPPGTRITVTGEVSGSTTLPLDETDYTYLVINIKRVQVWPHR